MDAVQWNLTNTVTHGTGQGYLNAEVTILQGSNNIFFAQWNTILAWARVTVMVR